MKNQKGYWRWSKFQQSYAGPRNHQMLFDSMKEIINAKNMLQMAFDMNNLHMIIYWSSSLTEWRRIVKEIREHCSELDRTR